MPERVLERIKAIVALYDNEEVALRDCLTDLMHLADHTGQHFRAHLVVAEDNYEAEKAQYGSLDLSS